MRATQAACLRGAALPAPAAHLRSARPAGRSGLRIQNLFTGIVQGTATIRNVDRKTEFCSFDIELPAARADNVAIGASVAINGTCLTVVEQRGATLRFDVMAETLRRTNLGALDAGSAVNFERSARVGDEIGGHTVSGHVHTTARIVKVEDTENNRRLVFELSDPAWIKYILPKGFVSVDGCSLTVGEVTDSTFSVYLIPETLRVTVAGQKGQGDMVNIEVEAQTQAIVDTVERVLQRYLESGRLPQPADLAG
ncbi:riboflavin synthase subunit alpha [Micractinium conductrix]|uniref:Riboflavin synthase subunit alpha n=1 Tax=Micractinium conductrix TaxID=554055 RepID=A0A2P6VQL4_9CHLO|nr:riboflavin synthase subunit alpha [Micractinium conductrix]|eukprot:PSC76357.1 riboflavin synthase subunit alpha [Micractinium conductrix]